MFAASTIQFHGNTGASAVASSPCALAKLYLQPRALFRPGCRHTAGCSRDLSGTRKSSDLEGWRTAQDSRPVRSDAHSCLKLKLLLPRKKGRRSGKTCLTSGRPAHKALLRHHLRKSTLAERQGPTTIPHLATRECKSIFADDGDDDAQWQLRRRQ